MPPNAPTWSVVTTVDEPPALVQSFVAWHLALGAEAIFVYLDRPDDPAAGQFAHLPQVPVVPCDDGHWSRLCGERPQKHQVRQVNNARDAYRQCDSDWLLHVDADEFIWPTATVASSLASVDLATDSVIAPVAERIWRADVPKLTIFDGAFRKPFSGRPRRGETLFGPDYALTHKGLTGHSLGKAFVRTGRDLRISIHRPRGNVDPVVAHSNDMELLHFDGLTPRYWIYKLMRMAENLVHHDGKQPSPHRGRLADALLADPDGAVTLHERLKAFDAEGLEKLKTHGLLSAPDFDPLPALARYFPAQMLDLSTAATDAWLAAEKQAILDFLDS